MQKFGIWFFYLVSRELSKIEDFEVKFFNEAKNFRSALEWNT